VTSNPDFKVTILLNVE